MFGDTGYELEERGTKGCILLHTYLISGLERLFDLSINK